MRWSPCFLSDEFPFLFEKKELILLEDQLEERVYAGSSLSIVQKTEAAVYRNIRTQFFYRLDKNVQFESYLSRDNARVPIVIRDGDDTLGIIVHSSQRPSLSETRSATSFLRNYANAKILFLSTEIIAPDILDERSMLCSLAAIL